MGSKPLILSNNWLDTVVQNPSNVVANSGADDTPGHEVWRISDNLRDASYWSPVATNTARSLQLTYAPGGFSTAASYATFTGTNPNTASSPTGDGTWYSAGAGAVITLTANPIAGNGQYNLVYSLSNAPNGSNVCNSRLMIEYAISGGGWVLYGYGPTLTGAFSGSGLPQFVTLSGATLFGATSVAFRLTAQCMQTGGISAGATTTITGTSVSWNIALPTVSPNILILDRGHNLAGATVTISGYAASGFSSPVTLLTATIPSTAGGLPTDTNGCVTVDGVWWVEFQTSAYAYFSFDIPALGSGISPIVTGLYLGAYYRFPEYALVPSNLDYRRKVQYQRNVQARAGIRVKGRPLIYGDLKLHIEMEDEDYIGTGSLGSFDSQVQSLFYLNAPWWFCQDDTNATKSGLMRLFQTPGDLTHDPAPNPRHRGVDLELEEVYPRVYT